jgi:hypothetical protein
MRVIYLTAFALLVPCVAYATNSTGTYEVGSVFNATIEVILTCYILALGVGLGIQIFKRGSK